MGQLFEFWLDLPTTIPLSERFVIQGWVTSQRPIGPVRLGNGAELQKVARPDVVAVYGHRFAHVTGFRAWARAGSLRNGTTLDIEFDIGGEPQRRSIELPAPKEDPTTLVDPEMKRKRLDRIRPLLRRDVPYVEREQHFDFLTPELRSAFGIVDTEAIASSAYDDVALDMIRDAGKAGGLVLDAGAGLRRGHFDNVVNLEIVPYPSTDVLGVGEQLPFVDACFDGVLSFAVLEHVTDPFGCARELYRVLKPGGKLYAVVPFLQPYHGYPSHYYNMTAQGLTNLFPAGLEVIATEVPRYGLPIWTLTWFLNSWQAGLPVGARDEFLESRVKDLLGDPSAYLDRDFVKLLPREVNFELASCTSLLGRRRE